MSQGYIQNFERNWKNSICIRVNNSPKSQESSQRKKIQVIKA